MNSKIENGYKNLISPGVVKTWKNYLSESPHLIEFGITLVLVISVLIFFTRFLNIIEFRNGIQFNDPFLKLLKPLDLSYIIFGIIYLSIFTALISLLNKPSKLLFVLQAYAFLLITRIITLYLVPLNAPAGMIPLVDPIVEKFGTGNLLTKDLFFSGHTATIFLLYLITNNKKLKIIFLFCFIILAAAVLFQHVHYTIDVFAAPFFAYTSYRIVLLINNRYKIV